MQALRAATAVRRAAVSAASVAPAPARAYSRRPQNLAETTYHLLFKRNFTYYTFVVAGAIILESMYGWVGDSLWASLNEGVRVAPAHWLYYMSLCACMVYLPAQAHQIVEK